MNDALDLIELLSSFVISSLGSYALVTWDERRLGPVEDARAWPVASKWASILAFGPLCLPVHFVRTRRTFRGAGLGFLALAAILGAASLLSLGLDALRTPEETPPKARPARPSRPTPSQAR